MKLKISIAVPCFLSGRAKDLSAPLHPYELQLTVNFEQLLKSQI